MTATPPTSWSKPTTNPTDYGSKTLQTDSIYDSATDDYDGTTESTTDVDLNYDGVTAAQITQLDKPNPTNYTIPTENKTIWTKS